MSLSATIRATWTSLLCLGAIFSMSPASSATDIARLRNGFTIRHERRQVQGDVTRLFLGTDGASYIDVPTADIEGFEKDLTPAPVRHANPSVQPQPAASLDDVVTSASAAYHLDPDLVNSVIRAESGFNSRAVSPKGAQGLMQLMPGTAGQLGVTDAFNPQENVGGGTRYLRQLLEEYHFDLVKALAAYNAGPQRVEQYRGVPPYRETRAYVSKIVRDYNRKKMAQQKAGTASPKAASVAKTRAAKASLPKTTGAARTASATE